MTEYRVAAIGECMLELSTDGEPGSPDLRLGYGGDTLNTAVYLARLDVEVEYVTALGDDAHSAWMLQCWDDEGVGTSLVTRVPGRAPGLYMIATDANGERRFQYWRGESPARELFDDASRVEILEQALKQFDLIYLSGISLSLYPAASLDQLFALLSRLRTGGVKIAFDGNYRPAGWPSIESARLGSVMACEIADLVMPTFEDEQALFGDNDVEETLARMRAYGVPEIVLKQGAQGCDIFYHGERFTVPSRPVAKPLDTTAAGDSFNAAYIAARLVGRQPEEAAYRGHQLASQVIQVRGAILPAASMPKLV